MRRSPLLFGAFFSFYILLGGSHLFSQNKKLIDSLKVRLTDDIDDSVRVMTLSRLGWHVSYIDLREGLNYCIQARGLAERIGYERGLSSALNSIGAIYTDLGDYPKALEAHLKQVEINIKLGDAFTLSTAYNNLSKMFCLSHL